MYRKLSIVQLNILAMVIALFITGCGAASTGYDTQQNKMDSGFKVTHAGTYDSADRHAVITAINKEEQSITFLNRVTGRKYTLNYDGASKLYDKYGSPLVVDQLNCGNVVDLTFLKGKKRINSLAMSGDAWVFDDQIGLDFDRDGKKVRIAGDSYRYDDKQLQVFADGKKADFMDVNESDVLTVSGYDREIYSIVVERSHGYLRLRGEEYFVGGYIEVGKIIQQVSEHMLLTVPEGSYEVVLTHGKYKGKSNIVIKSNEETQLDVSDFVTRDETQYGNLIFALTPTEAELYIDGEKVNTSKPYVTEYGIHQMIAKANGYNTITQYIKVGQENATLDVTLEKETDPSSLLTKNRVTPYVEPVASPGVSPSVISAGSEAYRVTIQAPVGAEVYVDGNYLGIAPASFPKTAGTHVISLRKEGYVTRSYTITVDSSYKNEDFSFSDLVKQTSDGDNKENDVEISVKINDEEDE